MTDTEPDGRCGKINKFITPTTRCYEICLSEDVVDFLANHDEFEPTGPIFEAIKSLTETVFGKDSPLSKINTLMSLLVFRNEVRSKGLLIVTDNTLHWVD